MVVLIILPILAFVLLAALSRKLLCSARLPCDWPAGMVAGGLLLCGFVVVLTEGLSLVGALAFWPVASFWVLAVIGLTIAWWPLRGGTNDGDVEPLLPRLADWKTAGFWLWMSTALVVGLVLLVALAAPPNTHDALAYHLPRQVRWLGLGAVRHYATGDLRELSFSPLAEYLQLHTMVLTRGDFFVNSTQWAAYVLTILASALACRALGCVRAAPLAAVLVASQPVAYLQAATPKNDPVLMFFVVMFAWLGIEAFQSRRCTAFHAALLGLSLGLAVLVKSTALVILFPFCTIVGFVLLKQHRLGALWRVAIVAIVAAVVVAGFAGRNMASFGHPLGPLSDDEGGYGLSMERHDASAVSSNLIRNLALHVPIVDSAQAAGVGRHIRSWHDALGWDADDPRTTWHGRYAPEVNVNSEGRAPAPVHIVLSIIAGGILVMRATQRDKAAALSLLLWCCCVVAFLIFVAAVKWNPWHTRLHAPIIALLAVPIAVGLWPSRPNALRQVVLVVVGFGILTFLLWVALINIDRPLIGPRSMLLQPRDEALRWRWPDQRLHVHHAIEGMEIMPDTQIAILAGHDDYQIMRLVLGNPPDCKITHIYPTLGRTGVVDSRWKRPTIVVSAFHVRPAIMIDKRFYVRQNEAASLNRYALVDQPPLRAPGGSIPYFHRYHGLKEPTRPGLVGRIAPYHAGHRRSHGLIVPAKGLRLPVPSDGQARTLLLALNPLDRDDLVVQIFLGEQLLIEVPALEIARYTSFDVSIPAVENPMELSIVFPSLAVTSDVDAAAVGWVQLPTNNQVRTYDRRARNERVDSKVQ